MKRVQRYDSAKISAKIDENGFLVDYPVVARIGLQVYQTPFGERREFRPASEVFKQDSLDTYSGKPITLGHRTVNSKNARQVVVGACSGSGMPDGIGVKAPLVVYDDEAIKKAQAKLAAEISVGYTSEDIDRAGWGSNETGEYIFEEDMKQDEVIPAGWVKFDALQTNIRVNHIALVFKGRAGVAKLNLDAEQEFPYDLPETLTDEVSTMTVKIKLDGEQEFDVPKAVADHINSVAAEANTAKTKADQLEAERDQLKAQVDSIPQQIEQAVAKAKADAAELSELKEYAVTLGVKCDGLDSKAIKLACLKEVGGKDLSDKSDTYIDSAFDFARNSDNMAKQRIALTGNAIKNDSKEPVTLDPNARFATLNK